LVICHAAGGIIAGIGIGEAVHCTPIADDSGLSFGGIRGRELNHQPGAGIPVASGVDGLVMIHVAGRKHSMARSAISPRNNYTNELLRGYYSFLMNLYCINYCIFLAGL